MIAALIEPALRALLLAAAVWVGLRLFRVANVLAQKAAWGLVLAAAILIPLPMTLAARWHLLPPGAALVLPAHPWQAVVQWVTPRPVPVSSPGQESLRPPGQVVPDTLPAADMRLERGVPLRIEQRQPMPSQLLPAPPPAATSSRARLASLTGSLYIAVCGLLLLRMLYGLGIAARLWFAAEPVSPECAPGLRIRASRAVFSPVTIGSGILLPASYTHWDAKKLRIVLAHERSHVRQGDFYLQLLAGLYAALVWFSPLGWWLKRKLTDLSEAISDRAGLEEAASRASYAQILLEFAARPRPTLTGVAMARPSNLSQRIERLLNESSFRQSFSGGRRVLLAVLLVPLALFAATALIRVEAASKPSPAHPLMPVQAVGQASPAPAIAPDSPQAPAAPDAPAAGVPAPPPPAASSSTGEIHDSADDRAESDADADIVSDSVSVTTDSADRGGKGYRYAYGFSRSGDSYALITGSGDKVRFSGDWGKSSSEKIKKARSQAHGDFLWFERNGKDYLLEDPAALAKIEALNKPMEELGRRQEELGRRQEALGRRQGEFGRQQELAAIPTPDLSKEMAELNASVAKLQAKKGSTISEEQIAELEGKIGELQGKLGELQGEIGNKQGALGAKQGELGEEQGKLGAEQGRLGAMQGKLAVEADQKVKSIIDEAMRDGKARPID